MGRNRYGKDGIRLVLVRRGEGAGGADVLRDLTVDVRLEGDFARVHTEGDNAPVLPTDTMRSTVYALAQPYLSGTLEAFGAALCARFLDASAASTLAEVRLREHAWVAVEGDAHAFTAGPAESATAVVTARRGEPTDVRSGLAGLTLLKTTGSAFSGFLRDELTVLAETDDRILATEATAQWTYRPTAHQQGRSPAYDDVRRAVRAALVSTFAAHESQSVQHTLHAMGEAVLAACDDLDAVTLRLPNKHHVLVDLAPFGLPNDRAVYVATDRPFGVIEGEVRRSDAVEG